MLIQNAKAFIDGKFQEKTDLLIRDGRISAIGTGLAAEGEELLDLGGELLLPGFVDVHPRLQGAWTPCRGKPSAI